MDIKVLYFAALRHRVGLREESIVLDEGATVGDLLKKVATLHEPLQDKMGRIATAVNQEYASLDKPLHDGDVVALLPPVAGGKADEDSPLSQRIKVKDTDLSVAEVCELVEVESGGAIVTFTGIVRRQSQGRLVKRLDYEAYAPMAEKEMARIADEIEEEWPGSVVAIHHRVGSLVVGQLAVVIAVCTPHRQEAFDGCSYAIERLKERVPIWKHEFFEDGSHWVGWGP